MHAPLSTYWLISGVMAAAAVFELFRSPKHAVEIFGSLGAIVSLVKFLANLQGVPAWPMFGANSDFPHGTEALVDHNGQDERHLQ
ncbi:MAG: hypothetical protein ABI205_03670 [Gemmatimonadaceae bacterium]